ncbi:MAG: hypothetical protein KC486_26540, partial [Myxococcales bacterium]|nr:hypothetical protein [Myxococcales bacterium]
ALLYQVDRGAAVVVAPERPALLELPAAGVAFGADEPEVVAAYFVDVDSAPSRDEFRALTAAMRDPKLAGALQLRLYHAPQVDGGCFAGDGPQAALRIDEAPCLSAAAIECVELLAPGAGIRMAGELFDRRRGATGALETATILEAASTLGLRVDAEQPGDPLLRCITSNRAIHGRLAAHAAFAARHGAAEVPHGYFVGVAEQRLDPARVEVFRGHLSAALRERKITSVRRPADAPTPTPARPTDGAPRH